MTPNGGANGPGAIARSRVEVPAAVLEDLRERLGRTRWPDQPAGSGWKLGVDAVYLAGLCEHWATRFDWPSFEAELNSNPGYRRRGVHFWDLDRGGAGIPVVAIHGWPGASFQLLEMARNLVEGSHRVIVPSLPGYPFSEDPGEPLNLARMAARLRDLVEAGLGLERYAVYGEDWGAAIGARMALDSPGTVTALHVSTPSALPAPGDLAQPPLSEAERDYAEHAARWRRREGFHLAVQGTAPDALGVALEDSPAGLAAWLVEKLRRWSDCDGEVESRFSRDEICALLTAYWATATATSSMRLYQGEARERWRLAAGQRVLVPCAVAEMPADIFHPPREWVERVLDVRRWTRLARGGHFAAFEEPALLARDLMAFLGGQESG